MPQIDDIRGEGERRLTGVLANINGRYEREIVAAVERWGSVRAIPQSFWDAMRRTVEEETAAALLLLILASDEWTAGRIERQGVRAGGIGERGLAYYGQRAATRAQALSMSYVGASREQLARAEVLGRPAREAVRDVLAASRTETAATTAATGTISDGQRGARDRALGRIRVFAPLPRQPGGDGATQVPATRTEIELVWVTEKDARVCPICRPLGGAIEAHWSMVYPEGPPGHPNCRCYLRPRVVVTRAALDSLRENCGTGAGGSRPWAGSTPTVESGTPRPISASTRKPMQLRKMRCERWPNC